MQGGVRGQEAPVVVVPLGANNEKCEWAVYQLQGLTKTDSDKPTLLNVNIAVQSITVEWLKDEAPASDGIKLDRTPSPKR